MGYIALCDWKQFKYNGDNKGFSIPSNLIMLYYFIFNCCFLYIRDRYIYRPGNKYFRLCRLFGLCCNYLTLILQSQSSHKQCKVTVPIKFYLQIQGASWIWGVDCNLHTPAIHCGLSFLMQTSLSQK